MANKLFRKTALKSLHLLGRLRRDRKGIAAVEFGFIAPVMLLMLVGTMEISRALTVHRRFGQATSMIADLITREDDMTAANLMKIYDVVSQVMGNYNNGTMKVSIIPVKANPSDATDTRVYATSTNRPSLNGGVDERAQGDTFTLAEGLTTTTVIVVKAEYSFDPIVLGYVMGNATWSETATLSPRNGASCVDFDDNNCVADIFD